jgi:hypothetical protein
MRTGAVFAGQSRHGLLAGERDAAIVQRMMQAMAQPA